MKIFIPLLFLFILFCSKGVLAEEKLLVDEYREKIILAHDTFFKAPSSDAFKAWYEIASEAYQHYPYNTDIARRFAFIAMQYASAGEAIKALVPLIPEMSSDQNIALGIWQVFDRIRDNAVYSGYNRHLYLNSFSNEDARDIINSQWKFWAGKIINIENLKPALREKIIEARNTSNDLSISDEEVIKSWQTILGKIYEHDLTSNLGTQLTKRYASQSKNISSVQQNKKETETLELLDRFGELPNDMKKIEDILRSVSMHLDIKKLPDDLPNYQYLNSRLKNPYELKVLNLAYKILVKKEYENGLSIIAGIMNPDLRILELKIYCLINLDRKLDEILLIVDEALRLKPDYPEMFMLKRRIEAEIEYNKLIEQNKRLGEGGEI